MKKIYVTEPYLPPLEEFIKSLQLIWDNKWLTNNGEFHQIFENKLAEFLGVKYVSLFSNGTLALITALQTLRITGEVITTPYSFVATTHSLWWNGIKPIFADIELNTCNINPDKIEASITPQTTAILPVHVYGNPCNVDKIQKIADTYGLKVIYDACHAFNIKINNIPIVSFGDLSVLSFHATKVFNTFEGGAIISNDEKTKKRIDYLKNFGFADEVTVVEPGINAKMNEFQAALGILQLNNFPIAISNRKTIYKKYQKELSNISGIKLLEIPNNVDYNYSYFPIFIDKKTYGQSRDELYNQLKNSNIFARRYFYPLISHFPVYRGLPSAKPSNLIVSEVIAQQVLCLPIYPDLQISDTERIIQIIKQGHE